MGGPASEERVNFWREHIEKQKISGKTISQYSKENNIADYNLSYWKSKLSPREKRNAIISPSSSSSSFTPVSSSSSSSNQVITITVPNGIRHGKFPINCKWQ